MCRINSNPAPPYLFFFICQEIMSHFNEKGQIQTLIALVSEAGSTLRYVCDLTSATDFILPIRLYRAFKTVFL
jgi:hypothetical protein